MNPDKIYTRKDMTRTEEEPCGFCVQVCKLCDGRSLAAGDLIDHDPACPFARGAVLAIKGVALTAARADICGACPADGGSCPAGNWTTCTHQTLMKTCARYVVDDGRTPK